MAAYPSEPVAQAIRRHQLHHSDDWQYHKLVEWLHEWTIRFNTDFRLDLPTPIIAIAPLPRKVIAQYRLGRNEIGARTTMTFNARWLPHRTAAEMLATLAHELLHAYEEWHLGRTQGGWYHTSAWQEKLAEVGIVADDHGVHREVLSRFTEYLQRYDMTEPNIEIVRASAPPKGHQMPKWVYDCPAGKPARAVNLNARCFHCGQRYRRLGGDE